MKQRLRSLSGRSVVVTGASSGIGRSLALRCARGGARIGLVARRVSELQKVADEIFELGSEAIVVPCDLTQQQQVEEAAARIEAGLGQVDLLVNNAGIGARKPFLDTDIRDFEQLMQVNMLGAVRLTKALLPAMVARGSGWLVFVASVAGRIPTPLESAYVASKFAIVGFAESLSLEVEDAGIHVLTLCPGIVQTPFFGPGGPPKLGGRFGVPIEPDALADAVLRALASGQRSLTIPKSIGAAYIVREIAPEFTRGRVKQSAGQD